MPLLEQVLVFPMAKINDDDKEKAFVEDTLKRSDKGEVDNSGDAADELPPLGTEARAIAEKKLLRKLDYRLLPTVFVINLMNWLDRNAIATARLKGMQEDLGINDVQYATAIAILYATYCPVQVPSNMFLNYIQRPSFYIGACVVAWGLTSALTGITKDFGGIIACRLFIGIPESAFYPGTVYLLSRWYTKKELALRSAFLYAGPLVSNAFGTLIAAAILGNMEGKRGIRAWRWLFFIAGAMTIVVGLLSMWLLPDYTHNTRWLSKSELRLAQARISDDAGEADKDNADDSAWRGLKMAIQDPVVPIFMVMTLTQLLGLSFIQFFPTLTGTLGFSTTVTLLLATPPWIVATVLSCINAWHTDQTGQRFFHLAGWWWGAIVGFIIALSTTSLAARYVSLFLMACGYGGSAVTLAWVSIAVPRPPAKRAAAIGLVNGVGTLGFLIGSYTWKAEWSPQFRPSMTISLSALVLSTLLAWAIRQILVRRNKKLDANEKATVEGANRARVEEAARIEGITFDEAMERRKGFRFLY